MNHSKLKKKKREKEGLEEEKDEIVQVEEIEGKEDGANHDENQKLNYSPLNNITSPREKESNASNSALVNDENQENTFNMPSIQEQDDFDKIENDLYIESMRKKISYWIPHK